MTIDSNQNSGAVSATMSGEAQAAWVVSYTKIRSFVVTVFAVPYTMLVSTLVIIAGLLGQVPLGTALARIWSRVLLALGGVRVAVRGASNVPAVGGGILVFNHQSHVDIPAIMVATDKHIRFGAKIELFKIPFFGAAMRAIGTLPIARDNRTEVLRIYREAQANFRKNILYVLAPEGTRQTEPRLGRFKKGPFLFAVNAQVPVVPVVIKGAFPIMAKNSLMVNVGRLTRTIHVEFLPPVATKGMAAADIEGLVASVRASMADAYEKLPG